MLVLQYISDARQPDESDTKKNRRSETNLDVMRYAARTLCTQMVNRRHTFKGEFDPSASNGLRGPLKHKVGKALSGSLYRYVNRAFRDGSDEIG